MNSINYRKATTADCEALIKIRMDNLAHYKTTETPADEEILYQSVKQFFETSLANGTFITWLACDQNEKIIATSGLTFFCNAPSMSNLTGKTGYITNMYTYPEYRRRGIGSNLLALTVEEAFAQGCGRIVLYKTGMGNGIYKNFGFEDSNGYMTYNKQ
ncbi:MAG: GNAT family N-acetyltransferase [Firmicutes bacterium]|nr:GNAT family N-acetyltransferase [Bacillota bacterium]